MNNYFVEQYYITKMIQNPVLSFMTIDVKIKELLKNYNINCDEQTYKNLENNIIKNKEKRKYTSIFLNAITKRNPIKEILKNAPAENNLFFLYNSNLTKTINPLVNIFNNFSPYQINYLLEKKLLSESGKQLLINVLLKKNKVKNLDTVFKNLKENQFVLSDIRIPVLIILSSLKNNITEEELTTEKYKESEIGKFNDKIELLKILIDNDKVLYEEISKILSLNNLQELIEAQDGQRYLNNMVKSFNVYNSKKFYGREFIIDLIKIGIEQKVLQDHINPETKNDIVTNKKKSSRL